MAKRMTESRKRRAMSHNRKIHPKDKDVRACSISFYDRGTHHGRIAQHLSTIEESSETSEEDNCYLEG